MVFFQVVVFKEYIKFSFRVMGKSSKSFRLFVIQYLKRVLSLTLTMDLPLSGDNVVSDNSRDQSSYLTLKIASGIGTAPIRALSSINA